MHTTAKDWSLLYFKKIKGISKYYEIMGTDKNSFLKF